MNEEKIIDEDKLQEAITIMAEAMNLNGIKHSIGVLAMGNLIINTFIMISNKESYLDFLDEMKGAWDRKDE